MPSGSRIQRVPSALTHLPHWWLIRGSWAKPTTSATPKRLIPDFPIRAYEYYDYRHDVVNTTFVNFQDNNQRGSGAISWLLFTGAGVTTENTVKSAKYINAKPVYFPKIDSRFDSDNRGGG